jgi:hypothetical protein
VHVKAECALRDHPSLGLWVRQLKSGRLRIDTAKVRAEDIALGYKNLLEAE